MRIILLALSMACTSDKSLNVNNSAPTATFTSHDEADTVTEGTTVLFSAALSDADDAVETLQARWFADDVEQCGLGAPDEVGDSSCSIWIEAGMHEIKVEVRDPSNAVGFGVYWLSIIQTNPPEVEILSPTAEEEYQASSSISFEAVASDSEDASDQLTIAWNSSLDGDLGLSGSPSAAGLYSGTGSLTEGAHTITVTATDTEGKAGNAVAVIQVGPANNAPVLDVVDIQDAAGSSILQAADGDELVCQALFSDADGDELSLVYAWTDQAGAVLNIDATDNSLWLDYAAHSLSENDVVTCTATASDGIVDISGSDSIVLLGCHPFATEIPYDGVDSNCDGLEYLNDQDRDGVPDDAGEDYDADDTTAAVLGLECYGSAHSNADGSEVYYLLCDNDQYWKASLDLCLNNGYDGLATLNDDLEYQFFSTITSAHLAFISPDGRLRSEPWLGLTRGPDCSPVVSTGLSYSSVCGSDIRSYYWIDGSSDGFIEASLGMYWHSGEMSYINEPSDYTMHNSAEHCAYFKIDSVGSGFFDLYCDLVPTGSHNGWSLTHTRSSACIKR